MQLIVVSVPLCSSPEQNVNILALASGRQGAVVLHVVNNLYLKK